MPDDDRNEASSPIPRVVHRPQSGIVTVTGAVQRVCQVNLTNRACRASASARSCCASPAGPTGGLFGENKLVYNDEFLATEIGQIGTQFDSLGHIGIQLGKDGDQSEMYFYDGFTAALMSNVYGLKRLGTEKLKPLLPAAISSIWSRSRAA